jgi:hypothetical protein
MSRIFERARVAAHEASHSLVAWMLGVPIEDVRLGSKPVCNLLLATADDRARTAVVCAAGSYGERALGFTPDKDGSREDKRQCMSLARGEAAHDAAHQQARELVEKYKGHVAALACLLLLRRRLSGREVAEVLSRPPPRRSRLGLHALGVIIETERGTAWINQPRRCSRAHYHRQVEANGIWYRALCHAARALCGPRREALVLALADTAIDTYPDPPAR